MDKKDEGMKNQTYPTVVQSETPSIDLGDDLFAKSKDLLNAANDLQSAAA